MPNENCWLSVRDISEVLGISRSAAYALLHRGELPHYRFGRRIRVAVPDLAEYIYRHKKEKSRVA